MPTLLGRLGSLEKQCHVFDFAHAMCAQDGGDAFKERLGLTLVKYLRSSNFFEALVDKDVQLMATGDGEEDQSDRSTTVPAFYLLVQLSANCNVGVEIARGIEKGEGLLGRGAALVRLLRPQAASPLSGEARFHILGVIWNVAMARGGVLRKVKCEQLLPQLLELVKEGASN